jgi:hypothetical protein
MRFFKAFTRWLMFFEFYPQAGIILPGMRLPICGFLSRSSCPFDTKNKHPEPRGSGCV